MNSLALARRLGAVGGLSGLLASVACSDEATVIRVPEAPGGPLGMPDPVAPPAGSALGPVYALQTYVFTDDNVTSYVTLTDTLDVTSLSTATAREYAGYAFITGVDGKLLVSDGESPTVTRYDITPELEWRELDTVSFANQGVTGGAAGFERHWFLNPTTAYVTLDITKRVIWNPTDMTITGVMEDSALEFERDGLQLDATFNRQPRQLRGPVLKPFYYRDSDWFMFGPTSPIAVYDPTTDAEQSIVDVPCPALEVPSQDEAGNTYFSSWTYGATLGLYGLGPDPCVRRIRPDSTLDAEWAPDLSAWTGGRPVKTFRYMRDGKAVATVLHTDELSIDFTGPYDEEDAAEIDRHWRLWFFDLEAQTARPIESVGTIDSAFLWSNLDGRSFVFVPYSDFSRSKVFELDTEGNATERFETVGFVNEWIRIR
jgi:hypothetical protein